MFKLLNYYYFSKGVNTSPIVVRQFATSISDINSGLPGSPNSSEELNQKNYNTVHTQTTNEEVLPKTIEESVSKFLFNIFRLELSLLINYSSYKNKIYFLIYTRTFVNS